ncbi:MAG: FKBP-type peptidyl-prolyl cis-trans isomerase [Deltaproteobacteria bacterium]|nr:FKBP-type peptidyl-prolyl cis-trans isomerase [Deltaproteobacteria bacterium]MBW1924775.1 FKBP-type peptidyl-prolyl cis-trans isomerase [Deltaproteobacteria bacterium]MBW1950711.1 FKBP-type peptidyl-prolyl cis-trans isomerase [Deltaproteobacteria bacterium]MBW2008317.1 FKBP-type peptidyl-prolyl cis-trans isomerase [Deltaproteobacteria bacterium]MBW2101144.1 FKBP-type peptidyl-prolyl cis-trans isomerase [Deltaproteobacteria bacterium]
METVSTDHVVRVKFAMKTHYRDGSVSERPAEDYTFIFGVERQAPSLESALEGRKVGERLNVSIPAAEIYGEHDPALVKEIPRKGLIKQRIREGQYYRQMKKGCLVSFKILEVRPRSVVADFNKPMAGISVSLDVEIMDIRKAGREEINAAIESQVKRSIGCG